MTNSHDFSGRDAPGVARNLYLVCAAGLTAFTTAQPDPWSGIAMHINIAGGAQREPEECASLIRVLDP